MSNKNGLKTSIPEKIRKMIRVSNRIRFDMMRDALDMDTKEFNTKIFDWAEEFNLLIDGDYIVINNNTIDDFINALDIQYKAWESKEQSKNGKIGESIIEATQQDIIFDKSFEEQHTEVKETTKSIGVAKHQLREPYRLRLDVNLNKNKFEESEITKDFCREWIGGYGFVERHELAPGQEFVVDNGVMMAYNAGIEHRVSKVGGRKSFMLGGEGVVIRYTGPGVVYTQNREIGLLASLIVPYLPPSR